MPYADRQRQRAYQREYMRSYMRARRAATASTAGSNKDMLKPLDRGLVRTLSLGPPGVVPYHRPPEEQRHSLTTRRQDQDAPSRAWIAELAEQRAMLAAVIECLRLLAGHDRAKLFIIEEYLDGPTAADPYTQRPTHHDIAAVT